MIKSSALDIVIPCRSKYFCIVRLSFPVSSASRSHRILRVWLSYVFILSHLYRYATSEYIQITEKVKKKSPEGLSDLFEVREHILYMIKSLALTSERHIDIEYDTCWLLFCVILRSWRTRSYLTIKICTEPFCYRIETISMVSCYIWDPFHLCLLCWNCVSETVSIKSVRRSARLSWFWIHRWESKKVNGCGGTDSNRTISGLWAERDTTSPLRINSSKRGKRTPRLLTVPWYR